MHIITVIPILKGISKDTLTYFTKEKVPVGSLVSISVRSRSGFGLVTEVKPASDMKMEIKNLSYNIKKIDHIKSKAFLSDTFIKSCADIANHYATTIGNVLSAMIPKAIIESVDDLSYKNTKTIERSSGHETLLLQSSDEERYSSYKSIIREEFARNKSIFFCLPTTEDIKNAKHILEKGIEIYTYTFHNKLKRKEISDLWKKILQENHPVLIIANGQFLSIPREDIGTIIMDKESSRGYKTVGRPFLDLRTTAEIIAKNSNAKLIFGDILLRVETLWKEKNGQYAEQSPLKFRLLSPTVSNKVDMSTPANMEKKDFVIISDELKKMLVSAWDNSERTFLFCGRKGLSPQTVCTDCGKSVLCNNCSAPVVLYKKSPPRGTLGVNKNLGNLFVCHHCGERRPADVLCMTCGGWRLLTLGIGVERVEEEIKTLFPDRPIFIMDTEHVTTHNQAEKIRDGFYASPGAIMIGTEMALTYLNQKIENSSIISIDSFFSIPDFRINEKIFHILLEIRGLTNKKIIIQTRQPERTIFDYAMTGNLIDFYRDEIAERKSIGYPPFVTYIKLTLEGNKVAIKKSMEEIVTNLKPYDVNVFDAFSATKGRESTMHGLISLPSGSWPDQILLDKLRALPPYFSIKVDPDTLL